eukprot:TRINITY_DN1057_c0_g1_i3.p1 TRINITY_DN1057_c0_g1~~TRINITY_DN1057_c0_g1_i3.p1  ORF type:complete len:172 (+),score=49.64 TRINITY_DN1057_c0_g1_i3:35-517(+)
MTNIGIKKLSEKIDDNSEDQEDKKDICDEIGYVDVSVTKLGDDVASVMSEQRQFKDLILLKELGELYHELKNVLKEDIAKQGVFIQKVNKAGIDETKFEILLEQLSEGVLEWANPEEQNRNALQLSWALTEREKLSKVIVIRSNNEFVEESKKKVVNTPN